MSAQRMFHLSQEVDEALRLKVAKDKTSLSAVMEEALASYLVNAEIGTLDISGARKRTFWLSEEVDTQLRIRAALDNIRYSDEVEIALRQYLGLDEMKRVKGKEDKTK